MRIEKWQLPRICSGIQCHCLPLFIACFRHCWLLAMRCFLFRLVTPSRRACCNNSNTSGGFLPLCVQRSATDDFRISLWPKRRRDLSLSFLVNLGHTRTYP